MNESLLLDANLIPGQAADYFLTVAHSCGALYGIIFSTSSL